MVCYRIEAGEFLSVPPEGAGADSIGFLTLDDLRQNREALGVDERALEACAAHKRHFRASMETLPGCCLLLSRFFKPHSVTEAERVGFLLQSRRLLVVQLEKGDRGVEESFRRAVEKRAHAASYELCLRDCFALLLESGDRILDSVEEQLLRMEDDILVGRIDKRQNQRMTRLRNRLTAVKRYYEELEDAGETLQENENEIFGEAELRFFHRFTAKAARLRTDAQQLGEDLVHLREALSAELDYRLNSTMQVLTVVSVIFLPLTLIVGWYGMNFDMPELTWKYGYLFVTLLCVAVTLLCVGFFRRRTQPPAADRRPPESPTEKDAAL